MMSKCRFRSVVVVGQVLLALLVLSGCDVAGGGKAFEAKPPFLVSATDLAYGMRHGAMPMYWLDNNRVLVPGYAPLKLVDKTTQEARQYGPLGLYILDTRDNSYVRHADLSFYYSLCYNEGFITYTSQTDEQAGNRIQHEGPFGQEKPLPVNAEHNYRGDSQPYYAACPKIDPEKLLRPEHHDQRVSAWFLREQDGYVYVAKQRSPEERMVDRHNQDDPVKYYRKGQAEPIELPILAKEMRYSTKLSYSQYAGKYLIIPHMSKGKDIRDNDVSWPKGLPYPVYLLPTDGKLETIHIPYGTWHPERAFLTRKGLFWVSSSAPSTHSKQAGGWLLQDGKAVKLFDHLPEGAGVSPDGCKIAYAVNDYNRDTTEFVHVIDLCK